MLGLLAQKQFLENELAASKETIKYMREHNHDPQYIKEAEEAARKIEKELKALNKGSY